MKLKNFAIRGFFWTSLSSTIVQSIQFITKIILARLLMPEDFGIVAVALVIINAFSLVNDFGGSTSIIYFKKKKEEVINTSFFITLAIGFFFFLFTFASAGIFASFFGEPGVANILRVFSVVFLLTAPSSVITSLLSKELKFNRLIFAETGSVIVYALLTLFLALKGYGVWSLVIGYISSVITSVIILMLVSGWKPKLKLDLKMGKKLLGYGKFVIGANILGFLVTQGDNAVVGKIIGSTALGFYVMAYSLANLPSTQIAGIISKVMFPTFSKLQNNFKRLKNAYLRTIEILFFFTIPFIFGTTLLMNEFVNYVLGNKWAQIVYPVYILLWFGFFRSIFNLTGFVYQSIGKPRIHTRMITYELIIFAILIFPLTIRWGIVGTSIAAATSMCISSIISLFVLKGVLDLRLFDIIRLALPTAMNSFMMLSLLFLVKTYIFPVSSFFDLMFVVILGTVAYAATSLSFNGAMIHHIKEILATFK